ncbi:Y-family DNA polymerase [Prochlorococcus sp. MIT 1341]|uniref:Y-family DNA polymerase n=1 Tax=Prochlorococcus sp. MIT 1341 TaxID=3096221 RepID=UPI002A7514BE|nr:Y-family DNA polymerase [Prochlorococcus sp. MIT 1341]
MRQATALIDGNNFYASCEQSLDPSLAGHPLIILSNNDGCIIARNAEARKLEIAMGVPYFKVRKKLKTLGVIVRSSNYALYADMSQRLMSILKTCTEKLEIYSIDEAFALVNRPYDGNLRPWARQLRAQVYQNLGLPIAIGIGETKGQAKLANRTAKVMPSLCGIFDLAIEEDKDKWLERIAIEDVWGIGNKLSQWCRLNNINTARQLRDMPTGKLLAKYGIKGIRIQRELLGYKCIPLAEKTKPKKETCVSRSFGRPICQSNELRQAIANYVVRGAEKLRRQSQVTASLTVFAITKSPSQSPCQKTATTRLTPPSNDTSRLLQAALPLTEQIFDPSKSTIKAGVLLQNLQTTRFLQQELFTPPETNEKLISTIDQLNRRYGQNTVTWGACGLEQTWEMRRARLSPISTSRFKEIPLAHA